MRGSVLGEARWNNAFGEPVDLDNIDREYALNIYTMVIQRRERAGYTRDDYLQDPLVQKLRDVILDGRRPGLRDRLRAFRFNIRSRRQGMPFRGRVL
jgi:hypothetical protein